MQSPRGVELKEHAWADTAASRILVTKSLRDLDTRTALLCARVGVNNRIDNLMRVVPPRLLDAEAASWDTKMRAYVATGTAIGQTLTDDAAVQMALPLREGGLGFLLKAPITSIAYLSAAAWLSCRDAIWDKFPTS